MSIANCDVIIEADVARRAAKEILRRAEAAVDRSGICTIALSGGSTPKALYTLLAEENEFRARMPWSHTEFFFGDERHVPPDHPQSNFRMVQEALFSKVPVPPLSIHRICAETPDAGAAAAAYQKEIEGTFAKLGREGAFPQFDIVLLGLGADGHTASLFPGSTAAKESEAKVVATWVETFHATRITLTRAVLNHAESVLFLVVGRDKAEILRRVLEGPPDFEHLPAQTIRPSTGEVIWIVDAAAASLLHRTRPSLRLRQRAGFY